MTERELHVVIGSAPSTSAAWIAALVLAARLDFDRDYRRGALELMFCRMSENRTKELPA